MIKDWPALCDIYEILYFSVIMDNYNLHMVIISHNSKAEPLIYESF